jgi:hypothetical protein
VSVYIYNGSSAREQLTTGHDNKILSSSHILNSALVVVLACAEGGD